MKVAVTKKLKKILIISYMFYPENNPRSFRAFELAKGLSQEFEVTILTKFNNTNGGENFKIITIPPGFLLNKNISKKFFQKGIRKKSKLKKIFTKIFNYFLYSREIEFSYEIKKYLQNQVQKYDSIISISNPFACHVGVWLFYKNKKNKPNIILDYGDPFYKNTFFKLAPYFKILERKILKISDAVVVPVENSKLAFEIYSNYIKKIKVIPQGLDMTSIKKAKYSKNRIPTFMYAGIFYERIRDPLTVFEKMLSINKKFKFFIYTDIERLYDSEMGKKILELVNNSSERIEVKNKISREECIYKMSEMDFLINIDNISLNQIPSKLIDYSLSGRPILNFSSKNFNLDIFLEFLEGNYDKQLKIDIEQYNIKEIINKFKELL